VLGDLASAHVHKPWVVGWRGSPGPVPLALERTVQAATRTETKADPGGPRALGQWVRRAFGVTVSAQGPIGAAGLPAVLLSDAGERGPKPNDRVRITRLDQFGKAALRTITAIDAEQPSDEPALKSPNGIVTMRNVLPDWAVRLVIATLLLPALLATLDAFFRARRRRVPVVGALRRLGAGAVGVLVAWLWIRFLGVVGLVPASDGTVLPTAYPRTTSAYVAAASAVLAGGIVYYLARRAARTKAPPEAHAVATGLLICALAGITWLVNPYAAALLLVAAHLWPFAAGGWRAPAIAGALAAGLLLPLLALAGLAGALRLGPLDLAWSAELATAGGHGLWTALALALLLAAAGGLIRVALARRRIAREAGTSEAIKTRGPLTYAGPGSLGGTESALRR
jgi:hypothetical protein